ncbi:MAG: CheR family methyltransferase [Thermodesulfovibrionales bacterium]
MNDEEFEHLRGLVSREIGIVLKGAKRSILTTKVAQRLGVLKLATYQDYCTFIVSDQTKEELYLLASHITNNETYFFRETQQLDSFSNLLRDIKAEKQKRGSNAIRILSLGSSTGEEAYTMNMLIHESGLFVWDWDIKITGIDIDRNALRKAADAVYSQNSFRMVGEDDDRIRKYFTREQNQFVLKRHLTRNVGFRHGNLLTKEAYAGLEDTDVVFCRNVLIYMNDDAIRKIAENLHGVLSDRGHLFVGASESLIEKTKLFYPETLYGTTVYRKKTAALPGA